MSKIKQIFSSSNSNNPQPDPIESELSHLFPINDDTQRQLLERNIPIDWETVFFKWKTPFLRQRMEYLMGKSPHKLFFEGLKFEFGYRGIIPNKKKAYQIYKDGADNANDVFCMYRIYMIHLRDYNKFNMYRDRVEEKWYLFKCVAYSESAIIDKSDYLFQRIDPIYEAELHFALEDSKGEKFDRMLQLLSKCPKYNFRKRDIILMQFCFHYVFNWLDQDNLLQEAEQLCFVNNSQGLNILAYISKKLFYDKRLFELYINEAIRQGNNTASLDYSKYLFEETLQKEKALEVALKGSNTNYKCGRLYCTLLSYTIDYDKLRYDQLLQSTVVTSMEYLINCLVIDDIYATFEFFHLLKILIKHYGLERNLTERYKEFIREFAQFIESVIHRKDYVVNCFGWTDSYSELVTVEVMYYCYKFCDSPTVSGILLEHSMLDVYESNTNLLNQQLYYYFVFKIRKYLAKNANNMRGKVEESEKQLVKISKRVYEEHFSTAPSTFYLLGRMHEKGYGVEKDEELAFSYYYITNQKKGKLNFFAPTFLSFRKYKAKKKIGSEYFKKIEEDFNNKMVKKFVDDDDRICCICYVNVKNIAFIPCMHKMCSDCYARIPDNEKCPICRGIILFPKKID